MNVATMRRGGKDFTTESTEDTESLNLGSDYLALAL